MKHFRTGIALSVALLAAAPLAFGQTPPAASADAGHAMHRMGPDGQRGDHHEMNMFQRLDLTEAQRTSLRQMIRESFQQSRPAMMALRQQRMAFNQATPGSADYQTLANNLAQAESTAAHDEVLRQAALRTRMYDVLTPAQKTKLAQLRAERRARVEKWQQEHQRKAADGEPAASSK